MEADIATNAANSRLLENVVDASSMMKLTTVATSLLHFGISSNLLPAQGTAAMGGYRCRFALQMVKIEGVWHYATRRRGEVVPIKHNEVYNVANPVLQDLMMILLQRLNVSDSNCENGYKYPNLLTLNLTSISFCSSWDPSKSILVTMHYNSAFLDEKLWVSQAQSIRQHCRITVLSGRAKNKLLRASCFDNHKTNTDTFVGTVDELVLRRQPQQQNSEWTVKLLSSSSSTTPDDTVLRLFKPEGAFFHPNPSVMCKALAWILRTITKINEEEDQIRKSSLLELYCGCGAHTIPLAQSQLLSNILAIELDSRLVRACRRNVADNGLEHIVTVIADDAAHWNATVASAKLPPPNILLVDPPRCGLELKVIHQAQQFAHVTNILYISCGKEALLRDLALLTNTQEHAFEVVDCTLLDLFPNTDSVESLVHLRRRVSDCSS